MGASPKIFFVNEKDEVAKVPFSRWERIHRNDPKESFPEFKNKKIRTVLAFVELKNRKPDHISYLDYSYTTFDSDGKIDETIAEQEMRDSMEMLSIGPDVTSNGNVINAEYVFAKKRYRHENSWKPSSQIIKIITDMIFGA
jgi:hypothetical protein